MSSSYSNGVIFAYAALISCRNMPVKWKIHAVPKAMREKAIFHVPRVSMDFLHYTCSLKIISNTIGNTLGQSIAVPRSIKFQERHGK